MASEMRLLEVMNTTKPNVTEPSCQDSTYEFVDWLTWSQVASMCIIGIFVTLQRRKKLCLGCTSSAPGVIYPVNLVDAYSDRFTFASAFCSTLKCVLDLFTGVNYIEIDTTNVPDIWKGTVNVITLAINVLLVCVAFYPIFLCLSTRFRILGNTIGLIYTACWAFYYVYDFIECHEATRIGGISNVYLNSPVIVCYFILIVRFTWGTCMSAIEAYTRTKTQQRYQNQILDLQRTSPSTKRANGTACVLKTRPQDEKIVFVEYTHGTFAETHYYEYVKHLLTSKNKQVVVTPSKLRKFLQMFYKSVPGFKYSRRFVCTIALSSLAVYQVWLVYVSQISEAMKETLNILEDEKTHGATLQLLNQTLYYSLKEIITVTQDTFIITSFVAIGITVFFIVRTILSYRQHTLMMYRGEYSFCPNEPFSNWRVIVSGFHYTGYHIAYTIWGCILLQLCLWASVMFCIFLIIYPFRDERDTVITILIKDYGLTLVVTYIFYYSQALAAFLFFLQNYGNGVLGLDNRRYFHNATYVLIFYNVVIGLASCLMRILKAIIFGLYYLGRLDRCLLMRGWELWDTGYRAYLGFLRLEIVHTHPVLITFCHCLFMSISTKTTENQRDKESKSTDDVRLKYYASDTNTLISEHTQQRRKIARNRWFVAVTLIRNSKLKEYRSPETTVIEEALQPPDVCEQPDV